MAAKYWIKLYHEILHDRKMGQLSDRLWRRAVEMFLFAGELNERGNLPSVEDMAWIIHQTPEVIETDLFELARIGIVEQRNGGWFVKNFAKRQAKMSKAEYMRRLRNERQKDDYYQDDSDPLPDSYRGSYQPVTNSNADKIRIDEDKMEDVEEEPATPAAASVYATVTGFFPSPTNAQIINNILGDNPIDEDVLRKAYDLWLDCKYSASNPSMCEWYHNLVADSGWIPPKLRPGSNGQQAEPAAFAAGRKILEDINNGNA